MMTGLDDDDSINRAVRGRRDHLHHQAAQPRDPGRTGCATSCAPRASRTSCARARRGSPRRSGWRGSATGSGTWRADPVHCSEGLSEMVGLGNGEHEVAHADFLALIDDADRPRVAAALRGTVEERKAHSIEYAVARPDGSRRVIVQEGSAVVGDTGSVERVVGIAQDITERRTAEDRIRSLANFDAVTGLPNRTFLLEILTQSLEAGRRYGRESAILVLDIDHFKRINDTLGHGAGDVVLQHVAQRLVRCVRGSDRVFGSEDSAGRQRRRPRRRQRRLPSRRRRVRRRARRGAPRRGQRRRRPADRRGAGRADRRRHDRGQDHRQHRHQRLPGRRQRRRKPAEERRRGDVSTPRSRAATAAGSTPPR